MENLELKRKYRNIATRERRKAIRAYWYKKTERLKSRPDKFYDTFKPFISNKSKETTAIYLKTEGNNVVRDQKEVAEKLAGYFTDAALNIEEYQLIILPRRITVSTIVSGAYKKFIKKTRLI